MPASALHLVPGDGEVGAMLAADRARGRRRLHRLDRGRPAAINRALAAKDGPIAPLIAETGGINAMIVDATALPEQVTDDVIASAFRSAGQRCSALRLLCVQEDVAERVLDMVTGAARELKLGDPRDVATQVGPVIDAEAKDKLERWIAGMDATRRGALPLGRRRCRPRGTYVAPADHRTRPRARAERGSVRPGAACGALARGRTRRAARRHRRQRHRAHARHPFAHRRDGRAHRRAARRTAMSTSTAT